MATMNRMPEPYRIMFVCTGNTCRSPMAEQVMRSRVASICLAGNVEVASSGLRVAEPGQGADARAIAALRAAGYPFQHSARHFEQATFRRYQLIVAMNRMHEALLRSAMPAEGSAQIALLRSFDPSSSAAELDVPDPVRGGSSDYQLVLEMIEAAIPGLISTIMRDLNGIAR
jgi:protein-tyrosine phosphatase